MFAQCDSCSMPYKPYTGDFMKCFACNQAESKKMIKYINRPKLYQTPCTTHLTREMKEEIAAYLVETHGHLYKSYRDSIPFIEKKFGITIDFKGVRSIVNSSYFQKLAFEDVAA